MRISDWSSDVCSSDLGVAEGEDDHLPTVAPAPVLLPVDRQPELRVPVGVVDVLELDAADQVVVGERAHREMDRPGRRLDRQSVVEGKSVSVRVDRGGRRILNKTNIKKEIMTRK